jgi:putative restriction endonuclease
MDIDLKIRLAAFGWLTSQVEIYGDVLPRKLLVAGFDFQNKRIPLISPQGIFKPRFMELPLSITTTPHGPYEDSFGQDNLLLYRYRGTDPNHRDNVGLRTVYVQKRPLVYFHGIVPGKYLALWPVFIVNDDPDNLAFSVAVEDIANINLEAFEMEKIAEGAEARRAYLTSTVKVRLHQRRFRERVLNAYHSQCTMCRLKHRELLDAAHIVPDALDQGEPTVNNGLALCKLHHAAFDKLFIGVTPDYVIQVREDILKEEDGPILLHGLQELHLTRLFLPRQKVNWPSQEALAWRFEKFQAE